MGRTEYIGDPEAPEPNSLVAAVSAVVSDDEARLLLHLRTDNQLWSVPGGRIEIGESVADAVTREVREETGFEVEPQYIVGVYSDPRNRIAYDDGEVRQQFSVCVACRLAGGELDPDGESLDVRWADKSELDGLEISPSIRLRIDDYLSDGRALLR